jgi:hypothetical protein
MCIPAFPVAFRTFLFFYSLFDLAAIFAVKQHSQSVCSQLAALQAVPAPQLGRRIN